MKKSVLFTSETCHLAQVRHDALAFLGDCGFDEEASAVLVLAIDEACTNVIRHAYHHKCRPVRLHMTFKNHQLRVVLRDYGKSCDPKTIKSRPLAEIRPGGVGVHIIRQVFDEVIYTPKPRGTELVMIKNLAPGASC